MADTQTTPYVGRAMKRLEDPRLIKGIATYVDDIRPAGLLHANILRSPHAHARIARIDVSAARAIPGVVAVLTGADVNDACGLVPCAAEIPDLKAPKHTVLAGDRVYFVGHAVAVAVASDPYIARDAIEAIEVDYDPLPVVANPEEAVKSGTPLTHPDMESNIAYTHVVTGGGDIDDAFRRADRVIKQKLYHQRLTPMPIEPRGVVASFHQGEGTLTLWTSTQIPHLLRTLLPGMIGVPENKLRIVAPEVGGGFGAKLNVYAEEALCGHLAMRLHAPVKWIESRRENAASTIHGRDQIGEYEVAVKNDGTILGIKTRTVADLGSYLQLLTPAVPTLTGLVLTGCYRIPAVKMEIVGVYTNKMATDAYRGAGRPEATYLIERLMDVVARECGVDRIDLRLKHFPAPSGIPVRHLLRPDLRQRQLSGRARQGEAARELGPALRRSRRGAGGGQALRHRRVDLRRDLRDGTVQGDAGRWLGVGLRAHGDLGQGHRDHRRVAARTGSGDDLRAVRRRPPRRAD